MIIFTGIFLLYTFLLLKLKRHEKKTIDLKSACTIGFFQAIALIPGLSRSGLTLTGGILSNNKINNTLKFSFYLYLIASFGAFILEITSINLNNIELYPIIISCIASFITTLFSSKRAAFLARIRAHQRRYIREARKSSLREAERG